MMCSPLFTFSPHFVDLMNKNTEVRGMYLAVDLKTNTIPLKHWQRIGGRTVKVSCELKAYDENGRAAEVLRRSRERERERERERGLSLEEVITKWVGKDNMEKIFKRFQLQT